MISRLRLALRQWRRIVLGTGLMMLFMGICLRLGIVEDHGLSGMLGLVSIILAALIISASVTVILALFLPGMLSWVEIIGLLLVVSAALTPLWERLKPDHGMGEVFEVGLMIALVLGIDWLIYGDWQNRFRNNKTSLDQRTIRLKSDPMTVWHALRPDPENPSDHYWPGTSFMPVPEGVDADFLMMRPTKSGFKDETLLVSLEDQVPGAALTIKSWPLNPQDAENASIQMDMRLKELPNGGTELKVRETTSRATWGQRFDWWLSNDLADHMASMRARIDSEFDGSIHGSQMVA